MKDNHNIDNVREDSQEKRLKELLDYNGMAEPIVIGTLTKEDRSYTAENLFTLDGKRLKFPIKTPDKIRNIKRPDNCPDKALARIRITVANEGGDAYKKSRFYLWHERGSNIEFLKELSQEFFVRGRDGNSILIPDSIYNAAKSEIDKNIEQFQEKANQIKSQTNSEIDSLKSELSKLKAEKVELDNQLKQLEHIQQTKKSLESDYQKLLNVAGEKFSFLRSCGLLSGEHFTTLTKETVPTEVAGETISWCDDLNCNWSLAVSAIHAYFSEIKNVIYPRWMVANFLTLLRTRDLIILSGLSGSGKTLLVRSMAEALGGKAHIIPVKPNWTGPEDLLGFFNPLQRTYVKTPFLEALLAAQGDPERLHLICLDEMNLARAEYYFADFLSELENRSAPSVKLYSESEKGHIIAELRLFFTRSGDHTTAEILNQDQVPRAALEQIFADQKENLPLLHDRLRRALATILDVPPQLLIPHNVRFIGAINVDQTTFGLSPKILDRAHVIRFENPLNYNATKIKKSALSTADTIPLIVPIAMRTDEFTPDHSKYPEYPEYDTSHPAAEWLKHIYDEYLKYLGIDIGYRTIRQAQAYWDLLKEVFNENYAPVAKSFIVQQKILPRFTMDGKVKTHKQGQEKERRDIVKEMEQDIREDASQCNFEPNMHSELRRVRMTAETMEKIFNYWA